MPEAIHYLRISQARAESGWVTGNALGDLEERAIDCLNACVAIRDPLTALPLARINLGHILVTCAGRREPYVAYLCRLAEAALAALAAK